MYATDTARGILLFVESAAKMASEEPLAALGNNGGYFDISECKKYLDYNLWDSKCKPSIEKSYEELFNQALWKIIEKHPQNNKLINVKDDFGYTPLLEKGEYKVEGIANELYGASNRPLKINMFIGKEQKSATGSLSFRPSFHITTDFDYSIFDTIQQEMSKIL